MKAADGEMPAATGRLLWRVTMRWRAAVDRALAPLGLTHAQYALLGSLYGMSRTGARPSQRELADYSGLEPMYVSKLARALERAGLVRRTGNPADPRAVQLTLTDRGGEVIIQAFARVRHVVEELTAPIGGAGGDRNRELIELLRMLLGEHSADGLAQRRRDAERQETSEIRELEAGEITVTTSSTPLTGQDIGEAANATRAVLDVLLDEIGTTFETWVTLNTLAQQGPIIRRDVLRRDLAAGFRADVSSVSELLGRLEADGLIREAAGSGDGDAAGIELAPNGEALWRQVRDGIGRITAELYGGLDPDDLATARRVLREVIERANARRAR